MDAASITWPSRRRSSSSLNTLSIVTTLAEHNWRQAFHCEIVMDPGQTRLQQQFSSPSHCLSFNLSVPRD